MVSPAAYFVRPELEVTVSAKPVVTVPDASTCSGTAVVLTATVTGGTAPYTYIWYGGPDGTGTELENGTENTLEVNPASTTTYSVIVTDNNGCESDPDNATVTVNARPPDATNPVGGTFCAGETATVRVNDPGSAYKVVWYNDLSGGSVVAGTSGGNNGEIFTPSNAVTGTYYAQVEYDAGGCVSASRTGATLTINSAPANASGGVGASYCAGDPIPSIKVNDPGTGFTVSWHTAATGGTIAAGTPGGNRGEVFTPSADATAIYYAEVKNNLTSCISLTRTGVTVTRNNLPANATDPVNSIYCAGTDISSVRVNDPGSGFIVRWYTTSVGNIVASGTPSGNNGEIFTPSTDMTATYYAEVENTATSCTSSGRVGATVTRQPAPGQATGPVGNDYCADEPIPSIRVNDPGNGLTIVWYANASGSTLAQGTRTGNNEEIFTASNNASATYYAAVKDDVSTCVSTTRVAVPLIKNPLPPNAANPINNTYCPGKPVSTISVDNPGTGFEVFWYTTAAGTTLAAGTRDGLNGEQFTPTTAGTYYAEVVNETTGCISDGRTAATVTEDINACSDANILSFGFNEQKGATVIDVTNRTITLNVKYGTSRNSLIASFTLSAGATARIGTVLQQSGVTANNFTSPVVYAVTAADGSTTRNWTVTVNVAQNDATDFLTFSVPQQVGVQINTTDHRIDVAVPFGTNLTSLVPTFTLSAGATARVGSVVQTSGVTANNFTNPVTYRITAQDGTQQDWVVNIEEAANTGTDFLTFTFPDIFGDAAINTTNHTIIASIAYGKSRNNLAATFTLSPGATARVNGALQQSGVSTNNFTNPVTYSVRAADGTTTQDWVVTINVAPNAAAEILTYSFPQQAGAATIGDNLVNIQVVPGTDLSGLVASFILSDGATARVDGVIQESGLTANDFTGGTLTYSLTAQDGTTVKEWEVQVIEQDIVDNEAPTISAGVIATKYPAGTDSIATSVVVEDNILIKRVVVRYKKYQETFWNEKKITSSEDSLYTAYFKKEEIGSHGLFYYFKAYDLKDNTDSTGLYSMVLSYQQGLTQAGPFIPGLTFGDKQSDYHIISIPMSLENNEALAIFDEFGNYNVKLWRLFHFNNGLTGEYGRTFTSVSAGKGYWLIIRESADIQVGAGTMSEVADESGFGVTLQPGWNQVGNPYNFELSWDDVIALNGNNNVGRIKTYDSGLLSEVDTLPAFRGGFVFLNGDQSILINLPPNPSFKNGGSRIGDLAWKNNRDIGGGSWFLPLTLSSGKFTSSIHGLGMHPGSEQGFDRYDEPLLPVPAEISGFEMYFPHEGETYDKISRDIVTQADFHAWEFEVNRSGGSGSMTFSWNNKEFGINNFGLILHDEEENRMIDMRSVSSYTFQASGNRKFRVLYGTVERLELETMPLKVHVGDIYPNPFTDELFVPLMLARNRQPISGRNFFVRSEWQPG
jgi:hypothetical protein